MATPSRPAGIAAGLLLPAAYPHAVKDLRLIETHISWVLLTGEYAYKVKKPVDLGFADFTTLERRHHFCEEEVRLNRRLAPDLYLDVVPIGGSYDSPRVSTDGEPIDYAVRMRQFPQESLLGNVLARGALLPEHIDSLAAEIAEFHARVSPAPSDSAFGTPDRVWQAAAEALGRVEPSPDDPLLVERLRNLCRHEFLLRLDDFSVRKALGLVRECHGDMHLGNMLLSDGNVVIFDGIEFNDEFRWIDVMSEVAFAVMDLDDRGRPDYARRLLNAYLERTSDYAGVTVLRFYLAYRAVVRAAVASIRLEQAEAAAEVRSRLSTELHGYVDLADRYLQPAMPMLVITHGVSGGGKTTVTESILEAIGAIRIRSDVERKRLFGKAPLDRTAAATRTGIYSAASTEKTYGRLAELAETIVRAGFPAIVDATFLQREERDRFRRLAERLRVPLAILDIRADDAVLRERIMRRLATGDDASDAGLAVLEHQLKSRDPLGPDEVAGAIVIDTGSESVVGRASTALRALAVTGG